jgi:transposase
MRGDVPRDLRLFSYVDLEKRIPGRHPLRAVRRLAAAALTKLSPRFDEIYSAVGRPSIPPEVLLRALLLQMLYSVRSERMLVEQLEYNLLFRWFVGLGIDDTVFDATSFSKNRERMLGGDIAREFFAVVVQMAESRRLLSDEHFTVDGTLLEAWASQKSFKRKDGGPPDAGGRDFRGEKRSNETHQSTTDPDSRLYRRTHHGEAKLAYLGHVIIENRNGLAVAGTATTADGYAERRAALQMLEQIPKTGRVTLGADKAYDVKSFVEELRQQDVTPHVTQNTSGRRSAIDKRTTRHVGYAKSQSCRPMIERVPAWLKNVALLGKLHLRGVSKVDWAWLFGLAAYNLTRMARLEAPA